MAGQGACVHSQRATAPTAPAAPDPELAGELSSQIAAQYAAVSDFQATVLISATTGGAHGGKLTRYPPVRGYLLMRKPANLRIVGVGGPAAPARLFDLVSDGESFRLSAPSKRRFVVGRDKDGAMPRSPNQLENIRPRHLLEVLLPHPIDPATETATVDEPEDGSGYTVRVARNSLGGSARVLWIDGATLHVAREVMLTAAGATQTDARFSQWRQDDGVIFPRRIEIDRPQEEYRLVIQIQKIEINRGLPSDRFVLEQPAGSELLELSPTARR